MGIRIPRQNDSNRFILISPGFPMVADLEASNGAEMALKLALLGAGRIGKVHAAAIAATPGASLVAVADALPEAAQSLAQASGAEVREVDAIMSASDIDAVLITTPTDLHATMIEAAAKAKKAIFCEKPIDLDVARVKSCLAVVARE